MQAESHVAHHFPNLRQQEHAARLGMWLFLATELLLFGGLFTAYSVYRFLYAESFAEGSAHLSVAAGTINTIVLITSSLSVALAFHLARGGRGRAAAISLAITLVFAVLFLCIKAWEWTHDFQEGFLPGRYFSSSEFQAVGAPMFFTLYFIMTGLHGLHVLVGMVVLAVLMFRCWRGDYDGGYTTPVELGGMYWHLVDLIWIFLYPLFYLV